MRSMPIAAILLTLALPAAALAGPEGTYHVKGVNPDDGRDYTGSVKIVRKGEVYRVVWQIGDSQTIGLGIGMRLIDGQMIAGAASDKDTAISISYMSGDTYGNATYSEFSDGTWRGVWAFKGYKQVSTEEWIPTVRQTSARSFETIRAKAKSATSDLQKSAAETTKVDPVPVRVISSPLPASASPKS